MTVVKPDNTLKIFTTVLVLLLSSLACGQQIVSTPTTVAPAPYNTDPLIIATAPPPLPAPTAAPAETARAVTVQAAIVNIRSSPAGEVVGQIYAGQSVTILRCVGDWCQIEDPAGWVWGGCLVGINDKGCEAKE